jgi:hypothetical protein
LLVAQRDHGIDSRRAARGDIACNNCHGAKKNRNSGEGERIRATHFKEKAIQHTRYSIRAGEAKQHSKRNQDHAFGKNQSKHIGGTRSQCHSNANFTRA